MGWVTLTLRKTELKRTHADYQMELLEISREKRKMARENHYEQSILSNRRNTDNKIAYQNYKAGRDSQNEAISNIDTSTEEGRKSYEDAQRQLNSAKEDYEQAKLERESEFEEEMARLEQEANDIETMLDQEQVEVEAQLEAISAELESVGEAISSQIQSSTIKLS